MTDYDTLLDEAKILCTKIKNLDTIINSGKITYIENIDIVLTESQLQSFISKRVGHKTRKDEICAIVISL